MTSYRWIVKEEVGAKVCLIPVTRTPRPLGIIQTRHAGEVMKSLQCPPYAPFASVSVITVLGTYPSVVSLIHVQANNHLTIWIFHVLLYRRYREVN